MFIKKFIQAVVLVYLYSQMVLCKAPVLDKVTSIPKTNQSSETETVIQLYNYASGQYLKILNKDITANGDLNDIHAFLLSGTDSKGIYIKGKVSGKFICFTKKGELKSRHKGRKKLCRFKDEMDETRNYRLSSVFNKNWKIGFDQHGQPVLGSEAATNLTPDRFSFMRYDTNKIQLKITPNIVKYDEKLEKAVKRQNNKKRRRRRTTRALSKLTTVRRRFLEVKPTASSVLPIR